MKKCVWIFLLIFGFTIAPTQKSHAIWWVVIKAAVKKAIQAADLAVQRQQNKVIWLQNAQKTIENAMSKLKLDEIGSWTEKQRSLYKGYFDELHKVRSIITYYKRIKEISLKQLRLVDGYKKAWSVIRQDKNFSASELGYIGSVYEGLLMETVRNIDQLSLVINSFTTTMTDAKRLEIINTASERVDQNYTDLRQFTNENYMLSLSRTRGLRDAEQMQQLYGIK